MTSPTEGPAPRRRRRTVLITSRWAASAAVVAAMTAGTVEAVGNDAMDGPAADTTADTTGPESTDAAEES